MAKFREYLEESAQYKVVIDVDNYNKRQEKNLIYHAQQAARKVQKFKKPITLDPLNPFQRRLDNDHIPIPGHEPHQW